MSKVMKFEAVYELLSDGIHWRIQVDNGKGYAKTVHANGVVKLAGHTSAQIEEAVTKVHAEASCAADRAYARAVLSERLSRMATTFERGPDPTLNNQ